MITRRNLLGCVAVAGLPGGIVATASAQQPAKASSEVELCYPTDMFLISGQELPLYPTNLLKQQPDDPAWMATFASVPRDYGSWTYELTAQHEISIDGARCGPIGLLQFVEPTAHPDHRYEIPLSLHIGAKIGSGKKSALFIGDSKTNRQQPLLWSSKMKALGYNAETIGTLQNGGGGKFNGEGREGQEYSDFTYKSTSAVTPVEVGQENLYLMMSEQNKTKKNPFLRAAADGDPTDLARNGLIFDVRFYLDRFKFADPDFVVINLGRNDISRHSPDQALSQVSEGFDIIYRQTRAALPNAHIGIAVDLEGRSTGGNKDWLSKRWPILIVGQLRLVTAARAKGDSKVWMVPAYAHMSKDVGFGEEQIAFDLDTGMRTSKINDYVHTYGIGRHQYSEAVVAWSHALASNT